MKYVYILESLAVEEHFYTGITDDLKARLTKHNAGAVTHTSKFRPWRISSISSLQMSLARLLLRST